MPTTPDDTTAKPAAVALRAYRLCLNPTQEQFETLAGHAGAARWAFNYALAQKMAVHQEWRTAVAVLVEQGTDEAIARKAKRTTIPLKPAIQKTWQAERGDSRHDEIGLAPWWHEYSTYAFQSAFADADTAWRNWLLPLSGARKGRLIGYPRFKKKNRCRDSFRIHHDVKRPTIRADGYRRLIVPRIGSVRLHSTAKPLVRAIVRGGVVQGELVAIVGPSGSGKTTLLHVMGTLERPRSGVVRIGGVDAARLHDSEVSRLRARQIGFVFQQFFLAEHATVRENVADGLLHAGVPVDERYRRADEALARVGLTDRASFKPTKIAGGQRQRVAIARALVGRPAIVLADEPTGNLDSATGASIMELIRELNTAGATILMITHDVALADRLPRQIGVLNGRVVSDTWPGHPTLAPSDTAGDVGTAATVRSL